MSREYMTQQRIKSQHEHKTLLEHCRNLIKSDRTVQRCAQSSTVSVIFANIVNSSNERGQRIFGPMNMNDGGGISHRYGKYDVNSCDAFSRLVDVSDDDEMEQRSSEALTKSEWQRKCESFIDEENVNFFIDAVPDEVLLLDNVWCERNEENCFHSRMSLTQ